MIENVVIFITSKIEIIWNYLVKHHKWVYTGVALTIIVPAVIRLVIQ